MGPEMTPDAEDAEPEMSPKAEVAVDETVDAGGDKATVRATIRGRRRRRAGAAAPAERLADGEALAAAALTALDSLTPGWDSPGSVVAAYRAAAGEPPTGPLLLALADRGVRVLVPRTRDDLDLEWHELRVGADPASRAALLRPAPMPRRPTPGQPPQVAPPDEGPSLGLDGLGCARAVLTPGLAADTDGHRLGQGGGCYDRALRRRAPGVPAVLLLFDDELLPSVPHDPHDTPVDGVITPTGGWIPLPAGPRHLGD